MAALGSAALTDTAVSPLGLSFNFQSAEGGALFAPKFAPEIVSWKTLGSAHDHHAEEAAVKAAQAARQHRYDYTAGSFCSKHRPAPRSRGQETPAKKRGKQSGA